MMLRLSVLLLPLAALALPTDPATGPEPGFQRGGAQRGGGRGTPEARPPQARPPQGRGPAAGRTRGGDEEPAPEPRQDPPANSRELVRGYFAIADYDANGFISFREAKKSLGLDHDQFFVFDADKDGRITVEEFEAVYADTLARGRSFPRPAPQNDAKAVGSSEPAAVLDTYDSDRDGYLDLSELGSMLTAVGRVDLSAEDLLERLDEDGTRVLSLEEIAQLSRILSSRLADSPLDDDPDFVPAASVEELFGKHQSRDERFGSESPVPWIAGPVPIFHRLDIDRDGKVTVRDLRTLQRPHQLPVSTNIVVSYLDKNGDGGLDRAELLGALLDD